MPKFLIKDKFDFHGLDIHYKVSGAAPSSKNPIFFLVMGSVNYSSHIWQKYAADFPNVNFIFVDFPGSGKSSKADLPKEVKSSKKNLPEEVYSIPCFTRIVAAAVEQVQQRLNVKNMQLFVQGFQESGLIAMNLPRLKPEWLQAASPIHLRFILNLYSPANFPNFASTELLRERYKDDPDLKTYLDALDKNFKGTIKDRNDWIRAGLQCLPLFAEEGKKHKVRDGLVSTFPGTTVAMFKLLRAISPTARMRDEVSYALEALNGCAVEVWNQFARSQFSGFDLEQIVPANNLYAQIPIVYVNAADDVVIAPEASTRRLQRLFPGNMAQITMLGREDRLRENAHYPLLLKALFSGELTDEFARNKTEVCSVEIPEQYKQQYAQLKKEVLTPVQPKSTTAQHLGVLGISERKPATQVAPKVEVETEEETRLELPNFDANYCQALRGIKM